VPGDHKRTAGSDTTPTPPVDQAPSPRSTMVILQRPGVSECSGCGVIAELVQDSDFCWACTYDPPCLCVGPRRSHDN
jgi:hypothetical protein